LNENSVEERGEGFNGFDRESRLGKQESSARRKRERKWEERVDSPCSKAVGVSDID